MRQNTKSECFLWDEIGKNYGWIVKQMGIGSAIFNNVALANLLLFQALISFVQWSSISGNEWNRTNIIESPLLPKYWTVVYWWQVYGTSWNMLFTNKDIFLVLRVESMWILLVWDYDILNNWLKRNGFSAPQCRPECFIPVGLAERYCTGRVSSSRTTKSLSLEWEQASFLGQQVPIFWLG